MSAPKAEKASEQKSLKAEREQEKAVKEQRKQAREKKPATAKKEETKLKTTPTVISNGTVSFKVNLIDEQQDEFLHQDVTEQQVGETIVVDGIERPTKNSNGDLIGNTVESLTNFWKWFGDSKVVDEYGRPLVVYHGSDVSEIEVFDNQANQTKQRQIGAEKGYFFTDSKKVAERFRTPEQRKAESKYYTENTVREPVEEEKYDAQGRYLGSVHYVKTTLPEYKNFGLYPVYLKAESVNEYNGEDIGVGVEREVALDSAKQSGKDGVIIYNADTGAGIANEYIVFEPNQIKSTQNRGTWSADENNMLKQSRPDRSRLDKGDTYRGAYDEKLKRSILNEKSDLTTIQHEFAHYWIQNNFRWYRSGLASDDWKRNWERVEQALGIEPTDKYLSKVASEKFARAYERYIMEGKVAPEYQWAFAEFQEFYNGVYEDLKAEYFDLNEELSPELIDWFNRQRPVAPEQVAEMRQNQVRSAIAQAPDNTIIESVGDGYAVVEENKQGEIESTIVVPRETIAEEKFGVPAKKTKSGLQESLRKRFGDDVNVDELVALDSVETLAQAESIIASNQQLAWEQMLSDSTNDVKRAYLYKAFAKMAENDPQIAVDLSNTNMAQWAREKGQAIQALNINDDLGLSPHTILAYMQNAKGKMSQEQLAQALNEIDLYAELSAEDTTSLENETECLL
jgi:hypothetical protein